jgi:LTXXQ motif family protein
MIANVRRVLLTSVALGALCLTTNAFARGGGHGGGGHFEDSGHFGGMHFGEVGVGDVRVGAAAVGHGLGHIRGASYGQFGTDARLHNLAEVRSYGFNRNAFGSERTWNRWGDRRLGSGWRRWGGWYGPVFWPYLYGDTVAYALWPGAYYDPFWAYGPEEFMSGIFWPGPNEGVYNPSGLGASTSASVAATPPQAMSSTSGMALTCSGLAPGVTGAPIDRIIARAVDPTGDQIQPLVDLGTAAARASEVVAASCPIQVPSTPLDRLDAVERRLDAMIEAMQIMRAPLERFYDLLSDAQKKRLSGMVEAANGGLVTSGGVAELCDPRAASFGQLPVDRIERSVQPTQQQEPAFEKLKVASANAAASLQASCPAKMPVTPVERIDAVRMRLEAMVRAVQDVRPALSAFYATLSDQQKIRFNFPASSSMAAEIR